MTSSEQLEILLEKVIVEVSRNENLPIDVSSTYCYVFKSAGRFDKELHQVNIDVLNDYFKVERYGDVIRLSRFNEVMDEDYVPIAISDDPEKIFDELKIEYEIFEPIGD